VNADEFEKRFGHKPERDDLHRVNCPTPGSLGHFLCGVCDAHNQPRAECGCVAPRSSGEKL
jgi:hypothetical protein